MLLIGPILIYAHVCIMLQHFHPARFNWGTWQKCLVAEDTDVWLIQITDIMQGMNCFYCV